MRATPGETSQDRNSEVVKVQTPDQILVCQRQQQQQQHAAGLSADSSSDVSVVSKHEATFHQHDTDDGYKTRL